jgi:hypothetical protein
MNIGPAGRNSGPKRRGSVKATSLEEEDGAGSAEELELLT